MSFDYTFNLFGNKTWSIGVKWSLLAFCYKMDVNRQVFGDLPTIQWTVRCHEYARQFLETGVDLNVDFFYVVHFMRLAAIQSRDEEAREMHGNGLLRCMDMFMTGLLGKLLTRLGVNFVESEIYEILNNPHYRFPPLARETLGTRGQMLIRTTARGLRREREVITEASDGYHTCNLFADSDRDIREKIPGVTHKLEALNLIRVAECSRQVSEICGRSIEQMRRAALLVALVSFRSLFAAAQSFEKYASQIRLAPDAG